MLRIRYFYIFFNNFINSKFIFKKPKKTKILIFDYINSHYLKKIYNFPIEVLYIRLEQINFFIVYKTILKEGFRNFSINYFVTYIKYVEPKVIITFNDLHPTFYKFKNKIKNYKITFISCQNGYRNKESFSHFRNEEKFQADIIFVFSEIQKKLYKNIISSKFLVMGSFLNNYYIKKNNRKREKLLFISQFKPSILKEKRFNRFINIEKKIIHNLNSYCLEKDIKYFLLTKFIKKDTYKKYFDTNSKCKFLDSLSLKSKYSLINKFKLVIFMNSSLGWESISKGNITMSVTPIQEFEIKKYFWVSKLDYASFSKKIDMLIKMSLSQWRIKNKKIARIIEYDKNNKKLITTINKFLKKEILKNK